jgi:hypothetical protein
MGFNLLKQKELMIFLRPRFGIPFGLELFAAFGSVIAAYDGGTEEFAVIRTLFPDPL